MASCILFGQGGKLHCGGLRWRLLFQATRRYRPQLRHSTSFITLDPSIGQWDRFRVRKKTFKAPSCFEKAGVAGIVDPVIPFQSVLQGLPADIAGADEGGAVKLPRVNMAGEQIGFHVEAAVGRLIYPDLSTLLLQQQQQAQRIGISDIQIVAGQRPESGWSVRGWLLTGEGIMQVR